MYRIETYTTNQHNVYTYCCTIQTLRAARPGERDVCVMTTLTPGPEHHRRHPSTQDSLVTVETAPSGGGNSRGLTLPGASHGLWSEAGFSILNINTSPSVYDSRRKAERSERKQIPSVGSQPPFRALLFQRCGVCFDRRPTPNDPLSLFTLSFWEDDDVENEERFDLLSLNEPQEKGACREYLSG